MSYDPYSFDAFQAKKKHLKKKLKIIILVVVAGLILIFIAWIVLFSKRPLSYDELFFSSRIEETSDGVCVVIFSVKEDTPYYTSKGGISGESYRLDFESSIDYRDWSFTLSASLWDKFFHTFEERHDMLQSFTVEGVQCEKMDGKWQFTRIVVGVPDENGKTLVFRQLVGRLFYKNPDGSTVLLWDFMGDEP